MKNNQNYKDYKKYIKYNKNLQMKYNNLNGVMYALQQKTINKQKIIVVIRPRMFKNQNSNVKKVAYRNIFLIWKKQQKNTTRV